MSIIDSIPGGDIIRLEQELADRRAAIKANADARAAREAEAKAAAEKIERARKAARPAGRRLREAVQLDLAGTVDERRARVLAETLGVEVAPAAFDPDGVVDVDGIVLRVAVGGPPSFGYGSPLARGVAVATAAEADGTPAQWVRVESLAELADLTFTTTVPFLAADWQAKCRAANEAAQRANDAHRAKLEAERRADRGGEPVFASYGTDETGRLIVGPLTPEAARADRGNSRW